MVPTCVSATVRTALLSTYVGPVVARRMMTRFGKSDTRSATIPLMKSVFGSLKYHITRPTATTVRLSIGTRNLTDQQRTVKRRRGGRRRKCLTWLLVLSYTKRFARTNCARHEGNNFDVDEQDIQRASDQTAAMCRHVRDRLLVRPDLVSNESFWRQTRTRNVHR